MVAALLPAWWAVLPAPGLARPPVRYYVALGDSLATGGGATPGHGYVYDVYRFEARRIHRLRLQNFACGGDSTTRMLYGGGVCQNQYPGGTQLGAALPFLRSHRRQLAFVTIDVGGDDIVGCMLGSSINTACVQRALATIKRNMRLILTRLHKAIPGVPLVGMAYYDPILGRYPDGPGGRALAHVSVGVVLQVNRELRHAYQRFHVPVADGQKLFRTTDWQPRGSFDGRTLPVNVANVCNWTHMCQAEPNIHPTDTGHRKLALAVELSLRPLLDSLGLGA